MLPVVYVHTHLLLHVNNKITFEYSMLHSVLHDKDMCQHTYTSLLHQTKNILIFIDTH